MASTPTKGVDSNEAVRNTPQRQKLVAKKRGPVPMAGDIITIIPKEKFVFDRLKRLKRMMPTLMAKTPSTQGRQTPSVSRNISKGL